MKFSEIANRLTGISRLRWSECRAGGDGPVGTVTSLN
jgi:hypothetical protein